MERTEGAGRRKRAGERERAGRREWAGLAVLALPAMLLSINGSVLHLALPALTADLAPTGAQALWIMDVYQFLMAGLLITMGALGDRFGRRRMLLGGAAAFAAASTLAAFAPSAELLIAALALMGVAGATLMPAALSLLRTIFQDARQRTLAITLWVLGLTVGKVVGPLVGGLMLESFRWGSVFLLGVPVMLLLLASGPLLLPEYRVPGAGLPDPLSAVLSLAAVLSLVYGLKQVATAGPGAAAVLAMAAGAGLGAAFVRRQRRLPVPMLDLALLADRAFGTALAALTLTTFAMGGTTFLIYQYLQGVQGLSALHAGLWLLPSTVVGVLLSLLAPVYARRFRPGSVMAAGLLVAALGIGIVTQVDGPAALAVLVAGTVVMRIGLFPVMILGTDTIVGSAPPERAGAASSLQETATELGMALGVAVLGSIGTFAYRDGVRAAVPEGAPAEAADTALGSINGAVALAARLPAQEGAHLLETAREAWTTALQLNAGLSAALFTAIAALTLTVLRRPSRRR